MTSPDTTGLSALALVCTLSPSPAESSSDLMARQVLEALATHGVTGDVVRVVDHDIRPGVELDMGDGDEWPSIRERIMAADILVVATPIWLGHPASTTQRVLERLDAELSETDEQGRPQTYGRVAVVAVVGNEDGAHHTFAQLAQGLSDVGFTIPPTGSTYWVGRAMEGTDFKDLDEVPEPVQQATSAAASNAAHLARLLKAQPFPPAG
jgi:multimeric flavodoxin WrbA